MYAILETGGKQYKVQAGSRVWVEKLESKEGDTLSFEAFFVSDSKKCFLGTPTVKGATVQARVSRHFKGDKIIVFKKKRRKSYRKTQGHRQLLTEILVEKIVSPSGEEAKWDKSQASKRKPTVSTKNLKKQAKPSQATKATSKKVEAKAKASATTKDKKATSVAKPTQKKATQAKAAQTKGRSKAKGSGKTKG